MSKYLTIPEVMEILKISRGMVRKMMKDGRLPAYKIGKSVRFRNEDIDKVLIPKEIIEAKIA